MTAVKSERTLKYYKELLLLDPDHICPYYIYAVLIESLFMGLICSMVLMWLYSDAKMHGATC